jgi:hypothetical protein
MATLESLLTDLAQPNADTIRILREIHSGLTTGSIVKPDTISAPGVISERMISAIGPLWNSHMTSVPVLELISRCVHSFLNVFPNSSSLWVHSCMKLLFRTLRNTNHRPIVETCIRIIHILYTHEPHNVTAMASMAILLFHFHSLKVYEQSIVLDILSEVIAVSGNPVLVSNASFLLPLMKSLSTQTRWFALKWFRLIVRTVPYISSGDSLLHQMITCLNDSLDDKDIVLCLVSSLSYVAREVMAPAYVHFKKLDLETLLLRDYGEFDFIIKHFLFRFILYTFFDVRDVLRDDQIAELVAFASSILPLFLRLHKENQAHISKVLKCSSLCLEIVATIPPCDLSELTRYVMSPSLSIRVLTMAGAAKEPIDIACLGWLEGFETVRVVERDKSDFEMWFHELLDRIGPAAYPVVTIFPLRFPNPKSLVDFFSDDKGPMCLNVTEETLKDILGFISSLWLDQAVLQRVADFCLDILLLLERQENKGKLIRQTPLLDRAVEFHTGARSAVPGGRKESIDPALDFAAIGVWDEFRGARSDAIVQWRHDLVESPIAQYIEVERAAALPASLIGSILFSPHFPAQRRMRFFVRNQPFEYYDPFLPSVIRSCKMKSDLDLLPFVRMESDDTHSFATRPEPIRLENNRANQVVQILRWIRGIDPTVRTFSPQLAKKLRLGIRSAVTTIGFFSIESQIMYHAPFLASFQDRLGVFKIAAFDCSYSFRFTDYFSQGIPFDVLKPAIKMKCIIVRENLRHCGQVILETFGPGICHLECQFKGQLECGRGPTQEFFVLFAKSFFSWEHSKLWVKWDRGLWPRPDAAPADFHLLGLLVGKALIMNLLVPIRLHPAFINLALANVVTLDGIDAEFSRWLLIADNSLGRPFTFPLLPDLELVEHGSEVVVTRDNVGEYVALVRKFALFGMDNNVPAAAMAFAGGLQKVIRTDPCRLLSGEELAQLIEGVRLRLTIEDIHENVGYLLDSQTLAPFEYFSEILADMAEQQQADFAAYVTGCGTLPVGGLARLLPRMTIKWRTCLDDNERPCAHRSQNCFELPCYSSKEVMQARIHEVITEYSTQCHRFVGS